MKKEQAEKELNELDKRLDKLNKKIDDFKINFIEELSRNNVTLSASTFDITN